MLDAEVLELVTAGLKEAVGTDCGLGKIVKFDFGPVGVVVIDATQVPNVVDNADRAADCTLKQTIEDFAAMNDGTLGGFNLSLQHFEFRRLRWAFESGGQINRGEGR